MAVTVFIVDDHSIFRDGLKTLLKEIPDVKVLGEAANGKEFLRKIEKKPPEIVLMDIKMPVMNGIEATRKAMEKYPDMKIIALSMFDDYEYLDDILEAGAKGFMVKNIGIKELINAIENLMNGGFYFCDNMVKIAAKRLKKRDEDNEAQSIADSLSKRELEILKLICEGLSTKQISEKLGISPRTVGGHRNNILKKTGLNNTASLVSFALNNKLVNI